ncbi:oxidoreductase [Amylibacter marinus]|uniref:Oxidoreductase n=1 Tax=Amylibacter marinus TaxID=1475483 RepID=A0ABQ5VTD2_9RHOB|nr:SDR family oxidoreductase [Amylibacter marinus]GLQ34685.1 oxidoreductase [Amylibacter marinus]
MTDLSDKSIFLTGSGGVLGSTYVRRMLDAGARVIASELPGARYDGLAAKFGQNENFALYEMDVADEAAVGDTVSQILADGHKPNVFFNNASITGEMLMKAGAEFPDLANTTLDSWNKALSVNLTGPFLLAREIDRQVLGKWDLKLINIASMYALRAPHHDIYEGMPFKNFSAYQATKAGIHGLTLWLASSWRHKATVNTLAPGAVFNGHSEEFQKRVSELIMQGRMAQPDEIADVALFLSSSGANHMTGQFVNVDGGYSAW